MRYMTLILALITLSLTMFGFAYAQESLDAVSVIASTPISAEDPFVKLLLESIGGVKGASSLAIALIVVKLLIASMNSQLFGKLYSKLSSGLKFAIASLLSYAIAVLSLVSTDITISAALIHSSVVPLLLAFLHQIYTIYIEKKTPAQLITKAKALTEKANSL